MFGADGIRGVVDKGFFASDALEKLGESLGVWWIDKKPSAKILIGMDTRESGDRIKHHLVSGLTRQGVNVIDGGVLPTPAVSFLIISMGDFDGGISISGSHLPVIENGIKVFDENGQKIDDDTETIIEGIFSTYKVKTQLPAQAQVTNMADLAEYYIQKLVKDFSFLKGFDRKIAIDYANGAACMFAQKALSKLGIKPLSLNASPSGTNINRKAGSEYARHSPKEFAKEFKRYGCEIGIALDGDADRVAFIDSAGKFYDGDMLLSMLALELQQKGALKNDTVVVTQMSNSGLSHHLARHGIKTKVVRNGDKYITDVIVKEQLALGGEQIGHVIISTDKTRVTGDGLRTALWVLDELNKRPFSAHIRDLMGGFTKWPQVNCSAYLNTRTKLKAGEIPGLPELLDRIQHEAGDLSRLECRPASTEPSYRVMLEAHETPVGVLAAFANQIATHVQQALESNEQPIEILDCVDGGHYMLN
jgi:phosphoglucosamine mutase